MKEAILFLATLLAFIVVGSFLFMPVALLLEKRRASDLKDDEE